MLTTSIDALDPNNTSRIDGVYTGEGATPRDAELDRATLRELADRRWEPTPDLLRRAASAMLNAADWMEAEAAR